MSSFVRSQFGLVAFTLSFLPALVCSQTLRWENTSWSTGPYGGDVTSILATPTGQMYAVSKGVGLFRSTDQGENWTAENIGLPEYAILSSLNCNDSGVVFLSTSLGLYSSSDGGQSWHQLLSEPTSCVTITTRGTLIAGALYQPVTFRSTDEGNSWDSGDTVNAWYGIISLASVTDGKSFLTTQQNGVFVSTNDGRSWSPSNTGFVIPTRGTPILQGGPLYVGRNGDVYAIENNLIYKSSNDGGLWELMPMDTTSAPGYLSYPGDFSSLIITSNGMMYTGSYARMSGVQRSTDSGLTWEVVNNGITEWWIECLAADSEGNIYAGTGGSGIFKSSDLGNNWNPSNQGLTRSDVQTVMVDSNGYVYAGTAEGGVYRSTDEGNDWVSINSGIPIKNITALIADGKDTMFAGTMGAAGVYRTANSGDEWYPENKGLTDSNVVAMAIDSSGTIFVSTQSALYRSTDGGANWLLADSGLDSEAYSLDCAFAGRIYAATVSGVYNSEDGGISWKKSSSGLPVGAVLSLAGTANRLFAGTSSDGVYCSTDSGRNWSPSNNGLSGTEIRSISVNVINRIFVGTVQGVYESTDDGVSWLSLNDGLTYTDVRDIAFDSQHYAYAATYGGGVFRTSEPTTPVIERRNVTVTSFSLGQNYPNPFNPTTQITYDVPKPSHLSLRVYDVLGRAVATLVNAYKSPGEYQAVFDGSQLPSGMYFYRLQAGSYTATKKCLLLK